MGLTKLVDCVKHADAQTERQTDRCYNTCTLLINPEIQILLIGVKLMPLLEMACATEDRQINAKRH